MWHSNVREKNSPLLYVLIMIKGETYNKQIQNSSTDLAMSEIRFVWHFRSLVHYPKNKGLNLTTKTTE